MEKGNYRSDISIIRLKFASENELNLSGFIMSNRRESECPQHPGPTPPLENTFAGSPWTGNE
ncbi:MAG TPA: hypothetical protein DCP63_03050 [Bacteroidetes bacterium]|nr:hypothetical protein [Bacteroidota bacterium]